MKREIERKGGLNPPNYKDLKVKGCVELATLNVALLGMKPKCYFKFSYFFVVCLSLN